MDTGGREASVILRVQLGSGLFYKPTKGLGGNTVRLMQTPGDQLKYFDHVFCCLVSHKTVALRRACFPHGSCTAHGTEPGAVAGGTAEDTQHLPGTMDAAGISQHASCVESGRI